MVNKSKKITISAPAALHLLWKEGHFKNWKDQSKVVSRLNLHGNNFPLNTLRMALARAKFLTSRVNEGTKEYIQKTAPLQKIRQEKPNAIERLFNNYDLHPSVKVVVGRKYEHQHYAESVEAAFKEVIKRVKDYVNARNGDSRLDGDRAMNRAFGFENQEPLIKFNAVQSDEEKDEQRGILNLFKGIVGIRNRKAHENIVLNDPIRALEYLALASLLMHLLDEYAHD